MADSTYQKIQQVLSDLIDRYGRVFWYDEGGQNNNPSDLQHSG